MTKLVKMIRMTMMLASLQVRIQRSLPPPPLTKWGGEQQLGQQLGLTGQVQQQQLFLLRLRKLHQQQQQHRWRVTAGWARSFPFGIQLQPLCDSRGNLNPFLASLSSSIENMELYTPFFVKGSGNYNNIPWTHFWSRSWQIELARMWKSWLLLLFADIGI